MQAKYIPLAPFYFVFAFLFACNNKNQQPEPTANTIVPETIVAPVTDYVQVDHPEWSKNATIYEVNIRQYTKEGTFKAFEEQLPRLKGMGIDILWLMPVHPIGVKNRKGSLGNYYSVKDYYNINPEFGTLDDFKSLVNKIHELGMYVIIDWVANHSAWDNTLIRSHPEWYSRSAEGNFRPTPWYDWDDVIAFDYNNTELRKYMIEVMQYWVEDTNIDGFRCDMAGFIPVDFWEQLRTALERIKPVFMLAGWESRDLHQKAFDMTYAWSLWDKLHQVCTLEKPVSLLNEYLAHDVNSFPKNAYRMTFTDSHDKNSGEGTPFTNFGKGLETAMAMTCTVNGMPLVYSGQEAGLDRSLSPFDKDEVFWKKHKFRDFFQKIFDLKHSNQALWNGKWGGEMIQIKHDKPEEVIAYERSRNGDRVITVLNFSDTPLVVRLQTHLYRGDYLELFSGAHYELKGNDEFLMQPWGYLVMVKE